MLFSEGLSEDLKPEDIYLKNKIVVLDFLIKEIRISGLLAVMIYKSIFMDAMKRPEVDQESNLKPVGFFVH